MNKKLLKTICILGSYLVVFCLSVTFAWMGLNQNFAHEVAVSWGDKQHGTLNVESLNLDIDLSVKSGNDLISSSSNDIKEEDIVPNDQVNMIITIVNHEPSSTYVNLYLKGIRFRINEELLGDDYIDIQPDQDTFIDSLFFSLSHSKGYNNYTDKIPTNYYSKMSDYIVQDHFGSDPSYRLDILERAFIPPATSYEDDDGVTHIIDSEVSFGFFILLERTATWETCRCMELSIERLVISL